jgi:KaiC/GvpD/RAD55 family RecA-like ATPase/uncharacterized protein (UPF0332 family)
MEKFIEIIEQSVHNRSKVIPRKNYQNVKRDFVAYYSMFYFTDAVNDYIEQTIDPKTGKNTIKGYAGNHGFTQLWIDIDVTRHDDNDNNIKQAAESTRTIIASIMKKFAVPADAFVIYFSGKKGFHVGIDTRIFNGDTYLSEYTDKVAKLMVKSLVDNHPDVDYVIYNCTRIFRCPYSKHKDTGMFKIPIHFNTLNEMKLDKIKGLARTNSTDVNYMYSFAKNEGFIKLFDLCVDNAQTNLDLMENISEEGNTYSINTSLFKVPTIGSRNDQLYRQAYRLFNQPGMKTNEIVDIMRIILDVVNKVAEATNKDKITDFEFRTLTNSAYNRSRVVPAKTFKIESLSEMAASIFKEVKELVAVPTGFPEWDEDLDGGFVLGNLYSVMGRSGTIKSLITQISTTEAAKNLNMAGLYLNMEMSRVEFFNRSATRLMQINFKDDVRQGSILEKDLEDMEHEFNMLLKNNYGIVSDNELTPDDIKNMIRRREADINAKVYWVVIDSMNSMKMLGSEAETAFKVTRDLKQVAKETKTAILLINHANQACKYHFRDVSTYVRGGAKVIDNCDAYICMSKIIDIEESNMEVMDYVYKNNLFYTRLVNKRGSGKTINRIIEVEEDLTLSIVAGEVKDYEVQGSVRF